MDDIKQKALGIVGSLAQKTAKATVSQSGFEQSTEQKQHTTQNIDKNQQAAMHEQTEQVVKSLYGIDIGSVKDADNLEAHAALEIAEKNPDMSPEDLKKQAALRMQLHQAYYESTFNKPASPEPTVTEQHEQEKQQEMVDLQEKKKKEPSPLAVRMAKNKAEQFPGTSG